MLFAVLSIGHILYCSCETFKQEITSGSLNICLTLLSLNLYLSFFNFFIDFFHNWSYPLCKVFDRGSLFIAPIRREVFQAILYFSFLVWKRSGDWSFVFETFAKQRQSLFLNLLFWIIRMSLVTKCPWFGSENGDVVLLQGELFILSKMSLLSNVFINSLWLNISDGIVLAHV